MQLCYVHDRHSISRSLVNWLNHWHGWVLEVTLVSELLTPWLRSHSSTLLQQVVFKTHDSESSWRTAKARGKHATTNKQHSPCTSEDLELNTCCCLPLPSKAVSRPSLYGVLITLFSIISWNTACGSEIRGCYIFSLVWAGGMQVWAPLPPYSQLLFLFQGKEGGFIVRDSSKAGKYTVSVFAKSTGWVLLFKGLGNKGQGYPSNSSLMVCLSYFLCP